MGYVTRILLLSVALAVGVGVTAGLSAYLATKPQENGCQCKTCQCRGKCRCCGACGGAKR